MPTTSLYKALAFALAATVLCTGQPSQKPLGEFERRAWFHDAKFGIFVHWGVYSVIGRHEWARHRFQIPQADYDVYARQFNPVKFDSDAWVDLAKNAGAKYMVITSKHHDGFSMYRSQVSDYDMEVTPYKGDPLKMLADSAKRKGMRLGFYHSIMDWHHPDYVPKRSWETDTPNAGGDLNKYLDFMKAQLKELLTQYGDVAVLWFDGEWEHSTKDMRSDEIFNYILNLQPNMLVNDRLFKRELPNRADFGTPEQFVPATGMKDQYGEPMLWESCVTINNDSWGYNKYETEFKTTRDLIRMLIEVVSKGGNLLLNVGPKPDGTIQDEFVTRLNAIGAWMKVNGEAIYGTKASPFARLPFFGRATQKENTIYLHVFQWPADGKIRVPGVMNQVVSAKLLAAPAQALTTTRDGADILISAGANAPDDVASVVALTLDGPPKLLPYVISPDSSGVLTLGAESNEIETRFEQRAKKENFLGHVFITRWTRSDDVPSWTFHVPKAGRYKVEISYGAAKASENTEFQVTTGGASVSGKVQNTDGYEIFKTFPLGEMKLDAGEQELRVKLAGKLSAEAMRLERIRLIPVL